MGQLPEGSYVLNRLTNSLSTEEWAGTRLYAAQNVGGPAGRHRAGLLAVGDRFWSTTSDYSRCSGRSRAGGSLHVEHGHREVGDRFSNPISARRIRCRRRGGYVRVPFLRCSPRRLRDGLYRGRRKPWRSGVPLRSNTNSSATSGRLYVWCGAWLATHRRGAGRDQQRGPLLNGLAARNVLFDVIYEHDLDGGSAPAVLGSRSYLRRRRCVQERLEALGQFASRGGKPLCHCHRRQPPMSTESAPRRVLFAKATQWEIYTARRGNSSGAERAAH